MTEGATQGSGTKAGLHLSWVAIGLALVVLLIVLASAYGGFEYYTSTSAFCGTSCHIMNEQNKAWEADKHHASNNPDGKAAECIACHFLPGEKYGMKAKFEGLRHLFAYLYDRDAPLPIRPKIPDGACLQSDCHAVTAFQDQEIKFTEKARFKHKIHFSEKALKGQPLTCDTCHFKVTAEKHFEVPKEICYLCHLKLEKPTLEKVAASEQLGEVKKISFVGRPSIDFNDGPSRCDICHEIPTKSLQSQLQVGQALTKPITHETMKKAGVACESCHFEVVAGHGEINTGNVVSNGCLTCHNRSQELIAKSADEKLMHDAHVAGNKADCFDCHSVIEHRNRTDHLDFVRNDCLLCHQDQHSHQRILLAGTPVNETVSAVPHLMFEVNVNCMGCHLEKKNIEGHAVRKGAPETCVACHTEEHRKMLQTWADQIDSEVEAVEEMELEVGEALLAAEAKLDEKTFSEVQAMLVEGREYLDIVRFGNGVHNKKYAIMILDEAFAQFEDALLTIGDQ